MQEKPTNQLDELLNSMKPEDMDKYLKDNRKYMADEKKGFYYYFKDVLESKNIFLKDIYIAAGVSEKYGGQILTMEKHTKQRDLILRLCIAGHFLLDETNRALKLYGFTPLYPKDGRDACIIVCIKNRKFELSDIDDVLGKQGFAKISVDD